MNDDELSPRLLAMREALAAQVDGSGRPGTDRPRRIRPRKSTVIAVVTAFVVGGALTGGLTAAAAAGNDSGDSSALETQMATAARYDISQSNHGTLVGEPHFELTSGTTELALGTPPAGADAVEIVFQCLDPGTFTQKLTGAPVGTVGPCGVSTTESPSTTIPNATGYRLTSRGAQKYTVASGGSARFAAYVSWARFPKIADMSAQQEDEVADGTVTLAEYETAFQRLQACMAEAGYPEAVVPLSGDRYDYAVPEAGIVAFDTRCYPREFEKVDGLWQSAHPGS